MWDNPAIEEAAKMSMNINALCMSCMTFQVNDVRICVQQAVKYPKIPTKCIWGYEMMGYTTDLTDTQWELIEE